MRGQPDILVNTAEIELWPHGLLRARSNHDARALARARHVLRRKRDGRYLAADLPEGLLPLVPRLAREPGIDAALDALEWHPGHRRPGIERVGELPLDRLNERLEALGLDDSYGERTGLALVAEPEWLALAGFDRFRRPLWLHTDAARAWRHLQAAADRAGSTLAHDVRSGRRAGTGDPVPAAQRQGRIDHRGARGGGDRQRAPALRHARPVR